MTKHTPGPWTFEEDTEPARVLGPGHSAMTPNLVASAWTPQGHRGEDNPNARLIAAAPALLEALEALLKETHQHADTKDDCAALKSACAEARAVIAQARGEK